MSKETREFWVSDAPDDAVRKAKITLNRLGELTQVHPGTSIEGTVAFGVQHVLLKIMWRPEEIEIGLDKMVGRRQGDGPGAAAPKTVGTTLILEATPVEAGGSPTGPRNALERFEDAYLHFDQVGYKPDRLGVLPLTIIGITVAVGLLLVLLWRNPTIRKFLPKGPPAKQNTDQNGEPVRTSQVRLLQFARADGATVTVHLPA